MTTAPTPSATTTTDPTTDQISARLRAQDFHAWRAAVETTGGCAVPIHLRGSCRVLDRHGAVLIERAKDVLAPCGNRRASICPACSDRYAADAFHLLRAGLAGDTTKGVPATVTDRTRAFLTLTAPSFGPVHTRKITTRGFVIPCGCGERHHPDDPRIGCARDPEHYDYIGAVLWQAHAGTLWARFTTTLRRALAAELGVTARGFGDHARLSYAKVAEYQRRGLVHFHAVIRLDGPDGPTDPSPAGLDHAELRATIEHAARTAVLTITRPDGAPMNLGWGAQTDLRPITPSAARELEDDAGPHHRHRVGRLHRQVRHQDHQRHRRRRPPHPRPRPYRLDVTAHHRAMIEATWELGGLDVYADLNLRRWAHMLGFRGHFLTKSQRYSTTFRAIRAERRTWRLREDLAQLNHDTDAIALDLDTVTVINDWAPVHFGHRDDGERELAAAIAERNRQQRRSKIQTRSAA